MKKYIAILSVLPLLACEKVIDYDAPLSEPMIVLGPSNALSSGYGISPNEDSLQLILSYSLDIMDIGDPGPITDAKVQIREASGNWISVVERANGYYSTNQIQITPGKHYDVKASASGYDDVTASCYIPTPVSIDKIEFTGLSNPDTMNYEPGYANYDVTITDPGDGLRYYSLSGEYINADSTLSYEVYLTSRSPYARAISDGDYYYELQELFASNELYEGKKVTIPIQVYLGYWGGEDTSSVKLKLTLRSMDEAAFRYHSSLQRYYVFGGGGDPFTQPVQVYSNVSGGLGFIGGYTQTSKKED